MLMLGCSSSRKVTRATEERQEMKHDSLLSLNRILASNNRYKTMLTPYKINAYCKEFKPEWACQMPVGCPPEDVFVPSEHPFFRLASMIDSYTADDFKSYAETDPQRNWGEKLPLAVGLSLIDNEAKARKDLKLPMFRQFKGIIALTLNPDDGVVKQTGVHLSHYTWWRTKSFRMSNLTMLQL